MIEKFSKEELAIIREELGLKPDPEPNPKRILKQEILQSLSEVMPEIAAVKMTETILMVVDYKTGNMETGVHKCGRYRGEGYIRRVDGIRSEIGEEKYISVAKGLAEAISEELKKGDSDE